MPLVTREINNAGQPILDAQGNPVAGAKIAFQLTKKMIPTDSFDTTSGERVISRKHEAVTDAAGLFTITLWPTDRGEIGVEYLCSVAGNPAFAAPLLSGDLTAIAWYDFYASGVGIVPAELTAFQAHINDLAIHHQHENKPVLDKFGTDAEGTLTYDGAAIGGNQDAMGVTADAASWAKNLLGVAPNLQAVADAVDTLTLGDPDAIKNGGGIPQAFAGTAEELALKYPDGVPEGVLWVDEDEEFYLANAAETALVVEGIAAENVADGFSEILTSLSGKKALHGIEAAGIPYVSAGSLILPLLNGEISYWFNGTRYVTTEEISIPLGTLIADTTYFVYFNDAIATSAVSTTPWSLTDDITLATVVWNGATGYDCGYELHSHTRNLDWHESAHNTYGTQYKNNGGGVFSAPTDSTFRVTPFATFDEDIEHATSSNVTICRHYFRKNGSSDITFASALGARLYRLNAASESAQYDNGSGTPIDAALNAFCNYWLYFTNDRSAPVAVIFGRGSYLTEALAKAEAKPALPNRSVAEWKFAYRLIYKNIAGVAGFQAIPISEDYRTVATGPAVGGGITTIAATNVTAQATAGLEAGTAASQLAELDSEKLDKTNGLATGLREANQQIITTAVTSIDWSLGHVAINYAGNTNLTGGFTNIPTDGSSWLTIEFRHAGGVRTLGLLASQLDPSATAPTLKGTSGGVDRLSLRPSLLNPGKYFIKLVESK
jgi:hypothetical protein